LHPRFTP